MSPETEKVLEDALKLPPAARAAIAGRLLDSLDQEVDPDAEAAWDREISRRLRELDSDQPPTVPWPEARRRIAGAG